MGGGQRARSILFSALQGDDGDRERCALSKLPVAWFRVADVTRATGLRPSCQSSSDVLSGVACVFEDPHSDIHGLPIRFDMESEKFAKLTR